LSVGAVTVTAEDWAVAVWFKRKFGDFCPAFGAGPLTLVHFPLTEALLVVHSIGLLLHLVKSTKKQLSY